jgi:1-acyl-sn-glycerol-3-phosphate acyltransferase
MQAQEFLPTSKTLQSKPFMGVLMICQIIAWLVAKLLTMILNRKKAIQLKSQDVSTPKHYVMASSHGSMLDPFLVIGHLNLSLFMKLSPFRFFAHNGLFSWWLKQFLIALGCFPASPHSQYSSGLDAASSYLNNGQTIFIFPEGKRFRGEKLKPRKGVAVLADMPNVEIIPVKITWNRGLLWGYEIVIGKPQQWSGRTADAILFDILTLE